MNLLTSFFYSKRNLLVVFAVYLTIGSFGQHTPKSIVFDSLDIGSPLGNSFHIHEWNNHVFLLGNIYAENNQGIDEVMPYLIKINQNQDIIDVNFLDLDNSTFDLYVNTKGDSKDSLMTFPTRKKTIVDDTVIAEHGTLLINLNTYSFEFLPFALKKKSTIQVIRSIIKDSSLYMFGRSYYDTIRNGTKSKILGTSMDCTMILRKLLSMTRFLVLEVQYKLAIEILLYLTIGPQFKE